jgi:hypothetical protein
MVTPSDTQNVGADLQRQICDECGHISINPTPPASVRSEVNGKKPGLFGGAPEFFYELAQIAFADTRHGS